MKSKQHIIQKELDALRELEHVDKKILEKVNDRIHIDPNITKSKNVSSHFCAFFLPVHKKTKSIYLVHHIKAQDWIPPGGHIEENEPPIETVKREFKEELSHSLTNEKIELFDISIKQISTDPTKCCTHHDLWHIVYVDKIPFTFDTGEFYDAKWYTFDEALQKIQTPVFKTIITKISKYI